MQDLTRRGLLGGLLASAGFALDPERLLWVPGRRLFSFPKRRVFYGSVSGDFELGQIIGARFNIDFLTDRKTYGPFKSEMNLEVLTNPDSVLGGVVLLAETGRDETNMGWTSLSKESYLAAYNQHNPFPNRYRDMNGRV